MVDFNKLNKLNKLSECTKCELSFTRKRYIKGKGSIDSDIMFIIDSPKIEDEESNLLHFEPTNYNEYVLNNLITNVLELKSKDIYITHVLKCRPQKEDGSDKRAKKLNLRDCNEILKKEIQIINPKIIILMGKDAIFGLLNVEYNITDVHGIIGEFKYKDVKANMMFTYSINSIGHKKEYETNINNDFIELKNFIDNMGE